MEEINMWTGLLRSILFIFIRPVVVDIFQSFPKWWTHRVTGAKNESMNKKTNICNRSLCLCWWSVVGGLTVWAARWWRHHQFSFRRVESVWVDSFLCTSIILVHVIHTNLSNLYNWTQVLFCHHGAANVIQRIHMSSVELCEARRFHQEWNPAPGQLSEEQHRQFVLRNSKK